MSEEENGDQGQRGEPHLVAIDEQGHLYIDGEVGKVKKRVSSSAKKIFIVQMILVIAFGFLFWRIEHEINERRIAACDRAFEERIVVLDLLDIFGGNRERVVPPETQERYNKAIERLQRPPTGCEDIFRQRFGTELPEGLWELEQEENGG